jgi:calreticulin
MFGPDICGSTKKVHLIFNFNGKNMDWKKNLDCPSDKLSHIFTAVIKSDDTYEVLIDGEVKESGKLSEDWDFMEPKVIPDPDAKKPEDWVDEAEILDESDKKPEDWDNTPKTIVDPEAKTPEDWNEEEDGKWEAPTIPNPDYKGEWIQKKIPNPKYKGEWQRPEIPNPKYVVHTDLHAQSGLKFVGFDLWQVKSGTVFSNILITDSVEKAEEERKAIQVLQKEEKELEEAESKKEEEAAKLRAEAAKNEEDKAKKEAEEKEKESLDKRAEEIKKESESKEKDSKDEL